MRRPRAVFAASGEIPAAVAAYLRDRGLAVVTTRDGDSVVELTLTAEPVLLLLSACLARKNGSQVCRIVRQLLPSGGPSIVLFGVGARAADRTWAQRQGPDAVLAGGCEPEAIAALPMIASLGPETVAPESSHLAGNHDSGNGRS